MRKRWLLLFVAVLLLAGAVVTRSLGTSGGLLYVSVDLKNAPFEEALRQLFSGPMLGYANYVVESGPAEGATATIRLGERTKATDALTQVLGQYGLRYRWVGATVYIFREGERPQPEEGLLLYLRRNGDRTQLRLRAYPYERGGEKLLWESPKDVSQDAYILPSPSFRYVVIAWQGDSYFEEARDAGPQLLVLSLARAAAKRIAVPQAVESAIWVEEAALDIATEGNGHWRYHPDTGKLTREPVKGEELLRVAYAEQVKTLEGVLAKTKLPFAFPTRDLEWALYGAVGYPVNGGANTWAPSQAALSPDGRHAALVGAEAAVYVLETATGAVVQRIPATRLVETEGVALGQLHWSSDNARLVFTESHFYAARFHALAGPATLLPSVTDWTYLVRQYTPATGRIETLTVGFDAFWVPAEAAEQVLAASHPHTWGAADDGARWGRFAGDDVPDR